MEAEVVVGGRRKNEQRESKGKKRWAEIWENTPITAQVIIPGV